jgi:hypothetical protein
LHDGFRWANVPQNLKIQVFAVYVTVDWGVTVNLYLKSPGGTYFFGALAKSPGITAKFYGIHADVERFVN